jgi:hypothetical protein
MSGQAIATLRRLIPSPSRGGLGWGWGSVDRSDEYPIPLPTWPVKGEGRLTAITSRPELV